MSLSINKTNAKYYDSGWATGEKFDNVGNAGRVYYNIREDNAGTPTMSEGNIHYTFDDVYQLTAEERLESDNSTRIYLYDYAYDKAGTQLVGFLGFAARPNPHCVKYAKQRFQYLSGKLAKYSNFGNRTHIYFTYLNCRNLKRMLASPANQLVFEDKSGGTSDDWHYVYDGNSNLTYKKDSLSSPTITDAFTYNYQNQLTEFDPQGASNTTTYTYNLMGQRVRKDSAELDTDRKFVYDGNGQILCEYDADDSDALLRTNIWAGGASTFIANDATDIFYYTFSDGSGSIYNMFDAYADVISKYDYTSFGEPYQWLPSESIQNSYTFTSFETNSENQSYHFDGLYFVPSLYIYYNTKVEDLIKQGKIREYSDKVNPEGFKFVKNKRHFLDWDEKSNKIYSRCIGYNTYTNDEGKRVWGSWIESINLNLKVKKGKYIYLLRYNQPDTKTGPISWSLRYAHFQWSISKKDILTALIKGYNVTIDLETKFSEWIDYGEGIDCAYKNAAGLLAIGHGNRDKSVNFRESGDKIPKEMANPWIGNPLEFSIFYTCNSGGVSEMNLGYNTGFQVDSLGYEFSKFSRRTFALRGRGRVNYLDDILKTTFHLSVERLAANNTESKLCNFSDKAIYGVMPMTCISTTSLFSRFVFNPFLLR